MGVSPQREGVGAGGLEEREAAFHAALRVSGRGGAPCCFPEGRAAGTGARSSRARGQGQRVFPSLGGAAGVQRGDRGPVRGVCVSLRERGRSVSTEICQKLLASWLGDGAPRLLIFQTS